MATVLLLRPRDELAAVLHEIAEADAEWRQHWNDERESELLDKLDDLRGEARAAIQQLTGVSWDEIEGAGL